MEYQALPNCRLDQQKSVWRVPSDRDFQTLAVRGDDDVANDWVGLGLRACFHGVALVRTGAVSEALLRSLGILGVSAIQVRLSARIIRDLKERAGVLGGEALAVRGDDDVANDWVGLGLPC